MTYERNGQTVINLNRPKVDIPEMILDLWAERSGGEWTMVANDCLLITPEDTYTYHSVAEAANDCLYTIAEWLKEA